MDGALSDIKVVELGCFISAPYCAKLLADLGAEVVKVEEPGSGDPARQHGPFPGDMPHPERSGLFLSLNANKLGITLNLDTATGRAILAALVREADVLVENNPPRLMGEWGLDYATLRQVNPRLIVTSITPWGQSGPHRDYKGYDINCCAAGGVSRAIGHPDREPLVAPLSQCDYQAGLSGAAATLAALFARDLTGQGQQVDISEVEVMATIFMGSNVLLYLFQGLTAPREGHRSVGSGGLYPWTVLPCKDGYMCLIAREGRQWKRFIEAIGSPAWSQAPRFRDRRDMGERYADEVDSLLAPWLMAHTKDEIFELCRRHRIPFTPVRDIGEVVNDPHLAARGFFVEMERAESGKLGYPGAPYKLSETPWRLIRPAPRLGEHNEDIFCQRLGHSHEVLAAWRRARVI